MAKTNTYDASLLEITLEALRFGHLRSSVAHLMDMTPDELTTALSQDAGLLRLFEVAESQGRFKIERALLESIHTNGANSQSVAIFMAKSRGGLSDKASTFELQESMRQKGRIADVLDPDLGGEGDDSE